MESYYTTILNIKNKDYLNMLKKLSIYYKYGKVAGDKIISNDLDNCISYENIADFLYEFIESNKILLNFYLSQGLNPNAKIIEFVPSSLLSFQNTGQLQHITSIIKYRKNTDQFGEYYIGTLKKSGFNIHDDFAYEPKDYDTVLNNSIIDILKNFNGEHDFISDVHGIKFAEDNDYNFFSGYAIKNSSLLRDYIIEDFIKSIEKTTVPHECILFKRENDYTLGLVKRNLED